MEKCYTMPHWDALQLVKMFALLANSKKPLETKVVDMDWLVAIISSFAFVQ